MPRKETKDEKIIQNNPRIPCIFTNNNHMLWSKRRNPAKPVGHAKH